MFIPALYLAALVLSAISGFPAAFSRRGSLAGQRFSTLILAAGSVIGLFAAMQHLTSSAEAEIFSLPWLSMTSGIIGTDSLTAFFLVPVFVLSTAGSVFGLSYWNTAEHPLSSRGLPLFWGLTTAGMILLLIARNLFIFLVGWETMALSAFFLLGTSHHQKETRDAAWIYFAATHVATILFFGVFAFWIENSGTSAMMPVSIASMGVIAYNIVFLALFAGFGLKAGIMPFHFWLPAAHANAPSHVSALMSGVVLKMGIYGLVRFSMLFENPPVIWGGLMLLAGVISGLAGVILAIAQHDLKRLLAYHSVENIGIILMGLGLAMIGKSLSRPELIVLGLAGGLLHVWNHALFKGLLFLNSGSIMHATGTRQLDLMGGLAKAMPWTAALFLTGAVSIAGLPPLNGFVSEFFLYLGFFHGELLVAVPAVALAMIGALAVACFVKAYGAAFLGVARNPAQPVPEESGAIMIAPMFLLAVGCLFIGLVPAAVTAPLEAAISVWDVSQSVQNVRLASLIPISHLQTMHMFLFASILVFSAVVWRIQRKARRSVTWDCGYMFPNKNMQYTASSFAQSIVHLFSWLLRPVRHTEITDELFPAKGSLESHVDEPVLDRVLLPASRYAQSYTSRFNKAHPNMTQTYILLLISFAALLLILMVPFRSLIGTLFVGR